MKANIVERIGLVLLALAAWCGGGGCSRAKPRITELQRKEADHLAAEAQFAMTLKDWARAEGLLSKAAQLVPDTGVLWVSLGSTRVRLGNKPGARQAYESALKAFKADAEADPKDAEPWLKQMQVLALLGRVGEARAQLDKTAKRFPENRNVKAFVADKQFDRMIADPIFKQGAL